MLPLLFLQHIHHAAGMFQYRAAIQALPGSPFWAPPSIHRLKIKKIKSRLKFSRILHQNPKASLQIKLASFHQTIIGPTLIFSTKIGSFFIDWTKHGRAIHCHTPTILPLFHDCVEVIHFLGVSLRNLIIRIINEPHFQPATKCPTSGASDFYSRGCFHSSLFCHSLMNLNTII